MDISTAFVGLSPCIFSPDTVIWDPVFFSDHKTETLCFYTATVSLRPTVSPMEISTANVRLRPCIFLQLMWDWDPVFFSSSCDWSWKFVQLLWIWATLWIFLQLPWVRCIIFTTASVSLILFTVLQLLWVWDLLLFYSCWFCDPGYFYSNSADLRPVLIWHWVCI